MILPYSAKTLNFFVATSALRLLTAKLKDFALPFRRCSHRALLPWSPLRQATRCLIPQRAITAVRSIFSRRAQSRIICSIEHENTVSTILGDTLPQTPGSPATTGIKAVAVSLTSLREVLQTIRDNAQRALTLIGPTEEQRSLGWKCTECGHAKHFTRAVPPEVAPPCPKCGGNSFEPC
jgi:hypothetical protein